MRLLCFFVFFMFAVFKSYAKDIVRDGLAAPVKCAGYPGAILAQVPTPWKPNYIYPVLECIKINGDVNFCERSDESLIRVIFVSRMAFSLLETKLEPKDFFVPKRTHCRLFHASEIAEQLKDHSVTDLHYQMEAYLYGHAEDETETTFQVTARALSYNISEPTHNIKAKFSKDRTVHAVICSFPNCAVVADGFSATRTEFFTIREGKTPQHKEWSGPLPEGMFSVTSFECEPENCPTRFSALNLAEPAKNTDLKNCLTKYVP